MASEAAEDKAPSDDIIGKFPKGVAAASAGVPDVYVRKSSGLIRTIPVRSATIANLIGIGIVVNIFWVVFASALYPNADLVVTVPIGLVINFLVAYVYWVFATAMPRTGGDYIYVSRIVHPILGFMTNSMFVALMITWVGLFPAWTALFGFQMMFTNLAASTGSSYYAGVATWLTTQTAEFVVGAIIIAMVMVIMMLQTKWIMRIVIGIFAVQFVIYLWFIGALSFVNHDMFVATFNSNFGTTVEKILSTAQSQYSTVFTVTASGTFVGIVYTLLSYIGYSNSVYFAGEVKGDPRKSQGLAIFLSLVIMAIMTYILYFQIYRVFGHDFLVAASTLALSGNGAWANYTSSIPSPAYLVSFISNNPVFVVAVPLGIVLTFIGFAIIYFFIPVRQIFAWSFDRIIPSQFSKVTRWGTPWLAVLLFGLIAYISLYITVYTSIFSYLAYTNFGWWLAWAIVMFTAAIFPFKAKSIFNSSPNLVRRKVGPVPIITLVGVAAGILSLFVSYFTILPAFTGFSLNPVYVASILVVFVVAIIIYAISYAYYKSKGVPVELVAKELPPT